MFTYFLSVFTHENYKLHKGRVSSKCFVDSGMNDGRKGKKERKGGIKGSEEGKRKGVLHAITLYWKLGRNITIVPFKRKSS